MRGDFRFFCGHLCLEVVDMRWQQGGARHHSQVVFSAVWVEVESESQDLEPKLFPPYA